MTEPIDVYVITRGIMDRLYLLQKIINIHRRVEVERKKKYAGWDLNLPGGIAMERVTHNVQEHMKCQ